MKREVGSLVTGKKYCRLPIEVLRRLSIPLLVANREANLLNGELTRADFFLGPL